MEFRKHTLDNGLDIVAECYPDAYTMALGFFVKTGSRDETDELAGVSHFLEHMVFKGTPTRTAEDVNREFDELGASYNAFTSEENTVYYASILPEYQEPALDLLADLMRPSLREEDFNTEKQVIIEEIHMYEDQPPYCADERCKQDLLGSHPLGRSVLGTVESIRDLSVDAMRDYFQRRYCPGNIALVASGRVDFDRLIAAADQRCGSWQPIEAPREFPPASAQPGYRCLRKDIATLEYVVQLAGGPSATDEDRFAAKVLTTVLGDDSGSRLYWELIDPGRVEHVSLSHHDYMGTGLFMTYLSCRADEIADNLQRLADVYHKAESGGFEKAEVEQAKRKIAARIVLGSERPRSRLFSVGSNWIQRSEHRTVKDDLDTIEAVTPDHLAAVLGRWPLTTNATIVIGPRDDVPAPR